MATIVYDRAGLTELFETTDGPVAKDLTRAALSVQRTAKRLCPVDTGRLRSSIAWQLERDSQGLYAKVGTNVEYAAAVEFGTRHQRAQAFLRPALSSASSR